MRYAWHGHEGVTAGLAAPAHHLLRVFEDRPDAARERQRAMIECPFCSGQGNVWDSVRDMMVGCPGCNGMGLIEAPPPAEKADDS
jgi:DnaJ-class molecular chaperone